MNQITEKEQSFTAGSRHTPLEIDYNWSELYIFLSQPHLTQMGFSVAFEMAGVVIVQSVRGSILFFFFIF